MLIALGAMTAGHWQGAHATRSIGRNGGLLDLLPQFDFLGAIRRALAIRVARIERKGWSAGGVELLRPCARALPRASPILPASSAIEIGFEAFGARIGALAGQA